VTRGRAGIPARGGSAERLNVVLIVSDDQRADVALLPNTRRLLARHGIQFTRSFTTTPLCCPSRAGILTGQYSHRSGVVSNSGRGGYPAFDERSNLAVWLQAGGYTTALVGKYLNGYPLSGQHRVPPGWSDWEAIDSTPTQRYYDYTLNENGVPVRYGSSPRDYSTTVLTGKALDFLRTARRPFFLYFAPIAPHLPATPAPRDESALPDPSPLERPSFDERDVSDKPWASTRSNTHRFRPQAIRFLDRSIRRPQLESLRALDRSVGALVSTLRRRGVLDRTVILYTSDNGFLWGEHRLGGKAWPYEESIRVPLVVRAPWVPPPGRVDRRLALNIDLASTIAELAGVRPGLPQDGRSLVPLLRGKRLRWRKDFVVEYLGRSLLRQSGPPPYRALRTLRYLYVEYENGWRELYDLAGDPWELWNQADNPRYARIRLLLAKRLHTLYDRPVRAGP
jgi:arylsulfatase A-like enzyme